MYSTHFIATPLFMDMSLLYPYVLLLKRRRKSKREHPCQQRYITLLKQNLQALQQYNLPNFCSVVFYQFYPSKMAILLTQENMFHHEQKKLNPSEYKTKVIRLLVFPKFIKKKNNTTIWISNRHHLSCSFQNLILEEQCKPKT